MTTIAKTSANAVSRKLSSLGFDKKDGWSELGFSVINDGQKIVVVNWTNADYPSTAATELAAAGYIIENVRVSEVTWSKRQQEFFTVAGRAGA